MKFTCLKEHFHQGLNIVTPVARKAVHLPILSNILLKAEPGGITLTSTNLELAISITLRAKIEDEGAFTLPAKLLLDIVASLQGEKVDCVLSGEKLSITSDHFKGAVKGMNADEYPLIPKVAAPISVALPREAVEYMCSNVLFAAAKNDPRQELQGIYMKLDMQGQLIVAATDSYRLAELKIALPATPAKEFSVVVPRATLEEVGRVVNSLRPEDAKEVAVTVEENQILFTCAGVSVISRLTEGKYPEYQQIIPQAFPTNVQVSRAALTRTVKSISLFSSTGLHEVALSLDPAEGVIEVKAQSDAVGEGTSKVTAEISGQPLTAVFNYQYLLDGLAVLKGDAITLGAIDGNAPAIFRVAGKDDYLYLVMPIKQ